MIAIGAGWEKGEAVRRWGKKSLASYEADLLDCLYQERGWTCWFCTVSMMMGAMLSHTY